MINRFTGGLFFIITAGYLYFGLVPNYPIAALFLLIIGLVIWFGDAVGEVIDVGGFSDGGGCGGGGD